MPIRPEDLDKILPKLNDPKLEAELHKAIRRIYEYIDLSFTTKIRKLQEQIKSGDIAATDLVGLIGVFSQPLAGSNINDPLLEAVLQTYGAQADHVFFAGPTPSFRTITLADLPAIPSVVPTQVNADGDILDINAIVDGEYVKRVGATLVSDIPPIGGGGATNILTYVNL